MNKKSYYKRLPGKNIAKFEVDSSGNSTLVLKSYCPELTVNDGEGTLEKQVYTHSLGITLMDNTILNDVKLKLVKGSEYLTKYLTKLELISNINGELILVIEVLAPKQINYISLDLFNMVIDLGLNGYELVPLQPDTKLTWDDLITNHSYVAYSDKTNEWDTMEEFLNEYEHSDIDYNWVIRWDITREARKAPIKVYIIIFHQRKGIVKRNIIESVSDNDLDRFITYIKKHLRHTRSMGVPIINLLD